jgi:hypothetical protein
MIWPRALAANSGCLVEAVEIETDIREHELSGVIHIELHYARGKSKVVKVTRTKEYTTPQDAA